MKTMLLNRLILVGLLLTGSLAHGQFVLEEGQVLSFPYRLLPSPLGCAPAPMDSSNSAAVTLVLDAESMASGSAFRMEILSGATSEPVASAVWSGSNSPLSLSYSAPGFSRGGVRLTGLTGSVSITSLTMPWSQGEFSVTRPRQWQVCHFDGEPIVAGVHLFLERLNSSPGVRLRWLTNAVNYRLEGSDDLRSGGWNEVPNRPVNVGSYWRVDLDSPNSPRFFRLKNP